MLDTIKNKQAAVAAGLATVGGVIVPATFAFAEGQDPLAGVESAVTGMATSVQTGALSIIASILPILGVVVAAVIVATLGYRLIKRFSKA